MSHQRSQRAKEETKGESPCCPVLRPAIALGKPSALEGVTVEGTGHETKLQTTVQMPAEPGGTDPQSQLLQRLREEVAS